jgi:hypothetical protein
VDICVTQVSYWISIYRYFRSIGPPNGYPQVLPGISAWYPPVGIALDLLIGMGPQYAPLYWLGLLAQR